jgi:hypothetical protein
VTKTPAYSNADQITGPGKSTYMFMPNVCGFPLPARLQWVETPGEGSGEWKSADVRRKMYTLIYPDPQITTARCFKVQDQDNGGMVSLNNKLVFFPK